MKNLQENRFSRPKAARQGAAHDCMDAGGTTPWMGEVDRVWNRRSRATQGAVAEGGAA